LGTTTRQRPAPAAGAVAALVSGATGVDPYFVGTHDDAAALSVDASPNSLIPSPT
jgi:hypothetical protein